MYIIYSASQKIRQERKICEYVALKDLIKNKRSNIDGLLLAPNPDKIFELGLISLDDNGKIIISSKLSNEDLTKLNINKDTVLDLKENHKKYIKYHRENKFKT